MILGPINLLFFLLTSAISLTMLCGGVYFVYEWYEGVLIGVGYLIGGIALIALSLFGRPLMLLLLGSRNAGARPATPAPRSAERIPGPGGCELYVEQFGPEEGPALILTHGLSMNGTAWNYVKQSLGGRYRLFVWDLP